MQNKSPCSTFSHLIKIYICYFDSNKLPVPNSIDTCTVDENVHIGLVNNKVLHVVNYGATHAVCNE